MGHAVEQVVETYLGLRAGAGETFIETWRRVGSSPFRDALYAKEGTADAA